MLDAWIKMAEKPQKNGKESCQKDWLNNERKSFKNWENITQKWKAGIICRKIGGFWPKQEGRNL